MISICPPPPKGWIDGSPSICQRKGMTEIHRNGRSPGPATSNPCSPPWASRHRGRSPATTWPRSAAQAARARSGSNGSGEDGGERIPFPLIPCPALIRSGRLAAAWNGPDQRLESGSITSCRCLRRPGHPSNGRVVPAAMSRAPMAGGRRCGASKPPLGAGAGPVSTDPEWGQGTWRCAGRQPALPIGRGLLPGKPGGVCEADSSEPFSRAHRQRSDDYPSHLLQTAQASPAWEPTPPRWCLLTQGCFNSAYSSTVSLAQGRMAFQAGGGPGSGSVRTNRVWMRSTAGLELVDVIYRRQFDDDFLGPKPCPPEFDAGGARADWRSTPPAGWRCQCPRHRRGRRQKLMSDAYVRR